ncbi:MAG: ROK family protein [Patescibacteria group bacterium]
MSGKIVRVIEGGGSGLRRADYSFANGTLGNFRRMENIPKTIEEAIAFMCEELMPGIEGVAGSLAGVWAENHIMKKSPNLHVFDGEDIGKRISTICNRPSFWGNDMLTAATGEAYLRNLYDFYILTVGGGIGGKRVYKGEVINPDAEVGHIIIDNSPYAKMCGCGNQGCVEACASGGAVKEKIIEICRARNITIPSGIDICKFWDDEYDAEKEWAIILYDQVAHALANLFTILQKTHPTQLIVVKGTLGINVLARVSDRIRFYMREKMRINPQWADEDFLKIEKSISPNEGSLVGAAVLWEKYAQLW